MKPLRIAAWAALAGSALLAGRMAARRSASRTLANAARPYHAQPLDPQRTLLIVGDSTALGTGADSPQTSLAGWIGSAHPQWRIDNRAANGARFAEVVEQLRQADNGYDLVLVAAGCNDITQFTGMETLHAAMAEAVVLAQERGRRVVLMPYGNVGHAPFFLPPFSWWMGARSRQLHAIAQSVAGAGGARYIRLLQPKDVDPFVLRSQEMHAADGLHPSSVGYRHWYTELVRQGGLEGFAH